MRSFKKKLNLIYSTGITYAVPSNLNYNWNYGIYAILVLIIQIISGILLAMHYMPNMEIAFYSVERIMRDVPNGWVIRYIHANGASFFFIVVYMHICRGIYYGSYIYPRRGLWCSGVIILLLMILTAFLGYILPWGQMSYWGATVITNLASTVPFFGQKLVYWLWGDFSVANATLNKFFSLHYFLPFVILGLVGVHVYLLHNTGSSNPLGVAFRTDNLPFHPYFTIKDFFSVLIFLSLFLSFVFFMPNQLGHPDNAIPANPELTPEHIVPEWYFLPFYAILRSIPDKLLGVLAMIISILIMLLLPFLTDFRARVGKMRPITNLLTIIFFADAILLAIIGQSPVDEPYLTIGRIATVIYFGYFLLLGFFSKIDNYLSKYNI